MKNRLVLTLVVPMLLMINGCNKTQKVYFQKWNDCNSLTTLINYVKDRPGHDLRYAIDPTKIHNELGWLPETKFADGIKKTIQWYLDNRAWWEEIISGEYQNYYDKMYGNR